MLMLKKIPIPVLARVIVGLLCIILMSACSSRKVTSYEDSSMSSFLIQEDDVKSSPLTNNEIVAFNSTGQIDKNIPEYAKPDIARQYKYFLRKGRNTISSFSKNSEKYLGYARQVFRSRGMPEELAYLAIVESGYRPHVKSHAGAVGAWQFMPATGTKYGLDQDWWTDDRIDLYEATEAAATYLNKLYKDFGDWPTAIAAYNAGEGKISRAKQLTGAKNFFEIKEKNSMLDEKAKLKEETKQYVPRFLAITKIMRNLSLLGFEDVDHNKKAEVVRLTAKPGTDLHAVSKACNINLEEFSAYNKHHKGRSTSTLRNTYVYLPAKHANTAGAFLQSQKSTTYANWHLTKVVSSADSWEKISKRSKVHVNSLKEVNDKSPISVGSLVFVPKSVDMSAKAVASLDPPSSKKQKNNKLTPQEKRKMQANNTKEKIPATIHVLGNNETLSAVARKYNVNIKELQEYNNIDDVNKVKSGKAIQIPPKYIADKKENIGASSGQLGSTSKKTVADNKPKSAGSSGQIGRKNMKKAVHTVQPNDSLWNIAKKYNVSVDDLKKWNNINDKYLRSGTKLVVNLD